MSELGDAAMMYISARMASCPYAGAHTHTHTPYTHTIHTHTHTQISYFCYLLLLPDHSNTFTAI